MHVEDRAGHRRPGGEFNNVDVFCSLLIESFFAIPGMGSFMLDAIQRQDFAVVQAMVSLGSFFYVVGLLLTDISYTLVDPRVRLE